MADLGTARVVLELDGEDDVNAGIDNAQTKVRGLATTLRGAGIEAQNFGTNVVGGVLSIVGAYTDFESQFANVRKTVGGTDEEMQILSDGVRQMAKDIPVTTEELNRIMTIAGQLGIRGTDNILSFTRVVADMTATTDLTADAAALAFARITAVTGEPIENVDRMGATIVALGNNFAATEPEIVDLANRMAGLGTIAGLSTAEILGLSAGMRSAGVTSELGGTAMIRTFIEFSEAVAEGGDQLDSFAEIAGVTSEEFANLVRNNPIEAMLLFTEGVGNLKDAEKDLSQVFKDVELSNIRNIQVMAQMGGAADTVRAAVALSGTAWDDNTALANEAAIRYETFASQLQIFKNTLNDVAITLGSTLVPVFQDVLDAAKPVVEAIAGFIEDHPTLARDILLVAGAFGAMAAVFGTLAIAIAVLTTIGAVATPIGWVVLAIGALIIAAGLLALHWDEVKEVFGKVVDFFEDRLPLIPLLLMGLLGPIALVIAGVLQFKDELYNAGVTVVETMVSVAEGIYNALMSVVDFIINLPTTVSNAFTDFKNMVWNALVGIWGEITGAISAAWEGIKGAFNAALTWIIDNITARNIGFAIGYALVAPIRGAYEAVRLAWEAIQFAFEQGVTFITQTLPNLVTAVANTFVSVVTTIANAAVSVATAAYNLGVDIVNAVIDGINAYINFVYTFWTETLPNFIINAVPTVVNAAYNLGVSVVNAIVDGIKSVPGVLTGAATWIKDQIVSGIDGLMGLFRDIGPKIARGIVDGLNSMGGWLRDQAYNFGKGIYEGVKDGLGDLWPFSPSERGVKVAEGFGLGLLKGMDRAIPWAEEVAEGFADVFSMIPDQINHNVSAWGEPMSQGGVWGPSQAPQFVFQVENLNARSPEEAEEAGRNLMRGIYQEARAQGVAL